MEKNECETDDDSSIFQMRTPLLSHPSNWQVSGSGVIKLKNTSSKASAKGEVQRFESDGSCVFTVYQVFRTEKNSEYVFRARVRCDDRLVVKVGHREMGYQTLGEWQVISDVIQTSDDVELRIEFIVGGYSNKKHFFELSELSFTPFKHPSLPPKKPNSPFSFHRNGAVSAVIVYPSDIRHLEIQADSLRKRLRELIGLKIPLISDKEATESEYPKIKNEYLDKNLIIIGRLETNRALWASYNRFKSAVDGYYPGGDGYVVRTAINVTPKNGNHIILGGSSDVGASKAIERFIEILLELNLAGNDFSSLPYLLDVKLGGDCFETFEKDDKMWRESPDSVYFPPFEPGYGTIVRWYWNAMCHYWSGWSGYLDRAEKLLERVVTDNAYTHHYISEWFVRVLNMFEGSGIFSEELTKSTDELLLKNFREYLIGPDLCRFRAFAPPFSAIHLSNRHDIAPWMGNLAMAEYLENHFEWNGTPMADILNYRVTEMRSIMDHMVEHRSGSTFPSICGSDNDEEVTASLFRYALDHEKYEFFEKGHAQRALSLSKINHVMGRYTRPAGLYDYHLIMGILAHYYQNGPYAALMKKIPEGVPHNKIFQNRYVNGVHRYRPSIELSPASLDDFQGIQCSHVEEYNRLFLQEFVNSSHSTNDFCADDVLDMVCFRSDFGKNDDYVAVTGTPGPVPAGAFLDFTSQGQYWFGAGDSAVLRPPSKFHFDHNALYVHNIDAPFHKRQNFHVTAKLDWCSNSPGRKGVSFTVESFYGVSWTREIHWISTGVFVVKDIATALEPGNFDIFINWFPEGRLVWNGEVMTARQNDALLHIVPLGDNFTSYQNIASRDDRKFLRQCFQKRMSVGDSATFHTVLYAVKQNAPVSNVSGGTDDCARLIKEAVEKINNPSDPRAHQKKKNEKQKYRWSYSSMRLPALIENVEYLDEKTADLGKNVQVSEIRAHPIARKLRKLRLPDTIMSSTDMRSWKKISGTPEWHAGLETGNYGKGIPHAKAYQYLKIDNIKARYIKSEKVNELLIFDAETQRAGTPLRFEITSDDVRKKRKVVVGPSVWPPFLRERLKENSLLAVLNIDGKELFKRHFEYNIQSWRICDLNGSGEKEIVVLTDDAKLRIIDLNGNERRVVDLFAMHEEFNARYGHPNTRHPAGGFTMPFDFGLWRPDSTGRQKIIISRYCGYTFLDGALEFEGVLNEPYGYVVSRLLPNGIDFSRNGEDEQLSLGKEGIHHISGNAIPYTNNPNDPLSYPQVYHTKHTPQPAESEKIDGEKVFVFSPISICDDEKRFVLVARSSYLGIYDGLERKWKFTWLPPTAITACDFLNNRNGELQVLLSSEDRRLWCLKWNNDVEKLSEYNTIALDDKINRIKAFSNMRIAILCGEKGTVIWRDHNNTTCFSSEKSQDICLVDGELLSITEDGSVFATKLPDS